MRLLYGMMTRSEMFAALAAEMKSLGFSRWRSNGEFVTTLGPGVEGWCSFPASKDRTGPSWRVATIAGVRFSEIERRITDWCAEPVPGWDGRSYVPSVSLNTGYLTPLRRWIDRPVDLSAGAGIEPLVADVIDRALPFLAANSTYAGLTHSLRDGAGQLESRTIERLPLAYAMLGDRPAAYSALQDLKQKVRDESLMSVRYLRYVDGFAGEFPDSDRRG